MGRLSQIDRLWCSVRAEYQGAEGKAGVTHVDGLSALPCHALLGTKHREVGRTAKARLGAGRIKVRVPARHSTDSVPPIVSPLLLTLGFGYIDAKS